ncbi:hypothetical protein FA95DRAFT_1216061 [Auriscalpium vulgare]|uniref:Uncharacterized protein n=1 Tax=Auriscalpium vulgare TaxID=40419 RepID=A0ACB8RUW2_9AGAM|nr:hypothetical protein FA95DRAFT_1216061 [Auriscalpium vulgare]
MRRILLVHRMISRHHLFERGVHGNLSPRPCHYTRPTSSSYAPTSAPKASDSSFHRLASFTFNDSLSSSPGRPAKIEEQILRQLAGHGSELPSLLHAQRSRERQIMPLDPRAIPDPPKLSRLRRQAGVSSQYQRRARAGPSPDARHSSRALCERGSPNSHLCRERTVYMSGSSCGCAYTRTLPSRAAPAQRPRAAYRT